METLLITVHYVICFFMIIVILLQAGKGADMGAVFGGASQTIFGGRGPATVLNKLTAFVAIGFIVTSISLAHMAKQESMRTVVTPGMMSSVVSDDKDSTDAPAGVEVKKDVDAQQVKKSDQSSTTKKK